MLKTTFESKHCHILYDILIFMIYFQCISSCITCNLFARSLELLNSEQNLRIVFNALEGSYALCLLANLIQLANIEREDVLRELYFPSFTVQIYYETHNLYIANKINFKFHKIL